MKDFVSAIPSSILSMLQRAALCTLMGISCVVSGQSVSAAEVVSVKVPDHSVTVKVDTRGKVNITNDKDQATDDEGDKGSSDDTDGQQNSEHHGHGGDVVQVFGDATLQAGDKTHDLVAVMGVSTNEGDVDHDVVSVFGATHVTGTVGHDAVAVMGGNYINNKVGHDVVAVMGNLELGPQAEIGNDVVVVGGSLKRDPSAIVHGHVNRVGPNIDLGNFDWLKAWFHHCLLKGRLLAFDADVMWAWWIALIALLAYVLTALLFPRAVERCVEVLEDRPGHVVLASLLAIIGIPVLMILLIITVIGIIAVPLVGIGLMLAGILGKVVILAWIGRRIIKKPGDGPLSHPIAAVLIGGALVLMLYTVPVLSVIVYKLIGFLGLGAVVYTLLLEIKSRRDGKNDSPAGTEHSGVQSSADLADRGSHAHQPSAGSSENVREESSQADLSSAATASVALSQLPRAGFWIRMIALLVDCILVGALTSIVIHPKWFGVDSDHVTLTLLAVYGAVMWKLKGATIGDIVFKLQVVRVDGREIDWSTAIVRSLGCFLSLVVIGLGFFWIAFDEHKQGWHDKIAGTVVVRNPKGISLV